MYTINLLQSQILDLLSQGYSNREIANELYIAEGTVSCYLSKILRESKLGNKVRLAMLYKDKKHLFVIKNYYSKVN